MKATLCEQQIRRQVYGMQRIKLIGTDKKTQEFEFLRFSKSDKIIYKLGKMRITQAAAKLITDKLENSDFISLEIKDVNLDTTIPDFLSKLELVRDNIKDFWIELVNTYDDNIDGRNFEYIVRKLVDGAYEIVGELTICKSQRDDCGRKIYVSKPTDREVLSELGILLN